MRRRALALGLLSSAAVLTVGYQLGAQTVSIPGPVAGSSSTGVAGAAAGSGSTGPVPATPVPAMPVPATQAPAPAAGASGTFVGTSESTRYGNVQVQITVTSGAISDVTALQLTDQDQRSVSISARAAPVLRSEVLRAQSANVQGVSGATYTTEGYLSSLQSALDQAGL